MSRLVSVRLDDESLRALRQLEDSGFSQSDAIRRAIISLARHHRRRDAIAQELVDLDSDPVDVAERREIATFMEQFRVDSE